MSDARARDPSSKAELITIWRSKSGATMMSVIAEGKVRDYELPRRRLAQMLREVAYELARED